MTRTLKATTIAWLTQYHGPHELTGDERQAINQLTFSIHEGMDTGENPWTRVGTAEITVTLVDEKTMVENKVKALRAEQTAVLAIAHAKSTYIDRQISQLLALDWDHANPAPVDDSIF